MDTSASNRLRRLLASTHLVRISANLGWLIADRLFRMAVGVVVLGAVARYLGRDQFGVLDYAISWTAVFASLATLGMEGIVIRELVKAPQHTSLILGTACVMRLVGSVVAMALLFLVYAMLPETQALGPMLFLLALAFLPQSMDVIDLFFQKNIESKYTILAKSAALFLGSVFKIALVLLKAPLVYFAFGLFCDFLFGAFALVFVYGRRGQHILEWRASMVMARTILRDCWPLTLSGLLLAFYMRVERFLIMGFLGEASLGVYGASVKITEMWAFIPTLILSTLYPLLVEARQKDPVKYNEKLQMVFDVITGIGYAVAIGATVLAHWGIPLIYGAQFKAAIPILMIQAWSAPVIYNGSVRAQYFLLENLTIYHTVSILLGLATNVCLSIFLLARFGLAGAALGALAGYWVSGYISCFLFSELRPCARLQTRSFLLPFRLPSLVRSYLAPS